MEWVSVWLSTFGVIFAIVDPFGYIPIFLTMTAGDSQIRRRQMLKKACLTAFVVLSVAMLGGNHVLGFFGISLPALQISGGLILLLISFEMLKVIPVHEKLTESEETEGITKDDISIIPLAIPMLSGPAAIASVIVLTSKNPGVQGGAAILVSAALTLGFTYFILRSAGKMLAFFGLTGLKVMTRIMGFLLCALAVQFILNGYLAVIGRG